MKDMEWVKKAAERADNASFKLGKFCPDDTYAIEELDEAWDQLQTAAKHLQNAAYDFGFGKLGG